MKYLFSLLLLTTLLSSCIYEECCSIDQPSGVVRVIADWSGIGEGVEIPESYQLHMICTKSGNTYTSAPLTETNNIISGIGLSCYNIYAYNDATDITTDGYTATVSELGTKGLPGVCAEPGWLFSSKNTVTVTGADTITINAVMQQQVRQLTIRLNVIKNCEISLDNCSGVLKGIAGTFCMDANKEGCPSFVNMTFCEYDDHVSSTVYLIGIVDERAQELHLDLSYSDGHNATAMFDLSDMLVNFNQDKTIPMHLTANLNLSQTGIDSSITDWEDHTQDITPS